MKCLIVDNFFRRGFVKIRKNVHGSATQASVSAVGCRYLVNSDT